MKRRNEISSELDKAKLDLIKDLDNKDFDNVTKFNTIITTLKWVLEELD